MRICQDIAEASKHAVLDRPTIVVERVMQSTSTFDSMIFDFSRFEDPEPRYCIVVRGAFHDAQDVVAAVVARYETFFTAHGPL